METCLHIVEIESRFYGSSIDKTYRVIQLYRAEKSSNSAYLNIFHPVER